MDNFFDTLTIDGFTASLEDEDGTVICRVTYGEFVSSLGMAYRRGKLRGPNGTECDIDPAICATIRVWARENGWSEESVYGWE